VESRFEVFRRGDAPPASLRPLPAYLYHYNQRLLPAFNHGQYGLLAFYNHWVRQGAHALPAEMDEAPALYLYAYLPPAQASAAPSLPAQPSKPEIRPARHQIFLVDVSASMNKPEKLPLVRELIEASIREMKAEDRISLLLYSETVEVLAAAAGAEEASGTLAEVSRIRAGGKTQLAEGLRQATSLGLAHYLSEGENQVFLISDGDFEVNFRLMRLARDFPDRGMSLSLIIASKYIRSETWDSLSLLASQGGGKALRLSADNVKTLPLAPETQEGPP
jgi:Mg-chelatase subunit ChlD